MTADIINFIAPTTPPKIPNFRVSAEFRDETWFIHVEDFYNKNAQPHEMFREIAEALAPLATGLIKSAEEIEPTKRGLMVANISVYRDGTISMHSAPLNTRKRISWMLAALDRVKESITPKKRVRQT